MKKFKKVIVVMEFYAIEMVLALAVAILIAMYFFFNYENNLNEKIDNVQQAIRDNHCIPVSLIGSARIDYYDCDGFILTKLGE